MQALREDRRVHLAVRGGLQPDMNTEEISHE